MIETNSLTVNSDQSCLNLQFIEFETEADFARVERVNGEYSLVQGFVGKAVEVTKRHAEYHGIWLPIDHFGKSPF